MKLSFFKSKKGNNTSEQNEELYKLGFTKSELTEYDKHVKFYYTNIINSLILFTYNSEQLDKMSPILFDPLAELYEELQYAFTHVLFETVFHNNLINQNFKEELLSFKNKVDEIPSEIWDWEFLDEKENWKLLRSDAEKLLSKMGITSRIYNNNTEHWRSNKIQEKIMSQIENYL
jgi:hypothetical protein